ncbi:putative uncharacterized protein DDB_G0277255 [Zootermopsis nevadensis]|nr:putative uncharacterized protein DDB_G0277255 [Zootermopsis nevadensis]
MEARVLLLTALLMAVDGRWIVDGDGFYHLPPVCGSDARVYSSIHELEYAKYITGIEDLYEVPFSHCENQASTNPAIVNPTEPEWKKFVFPLHFRTKDEGSRLYPNNQPRKFALGDDSEHRDVPYIKAQLQKMTKQPHEVRYHNYNEFRYEAPESRESQIHRSALVSREDNLIQLSPRIGESYLNTQLPTRLQNPNIRRNDFAYHQSIIPNHPLDLFALAAQHKQSGRYPYVTYEQVQYNTENSPIENQYTASYISPSYNETNDSKPYLKQWPEIIRHRYSVPNHEINKYLRQSIDDSAYVSRKNHQLTKQKYQKIEYLLTGITRKKNQQKPLEQAKGYPDDKQMPDQTPVISQRIGTDLLLANFAEGQNENTSESQSNDFDTNIQHSENTKQSTCLCGQPKSNADSLNDHGSFANQQIGSEKPSAEISNRQNKTETETQPNDFVSNIQNSLNGQQTTRDCYKANVQPETIRHETPFIKQSTDTDVKSAILPTEKKPQIGVSATGIQNSLNSQQSLYPYKQEVQEQILNPIPLTQKPVGVGIIPTEIPAEQNATENGTQINSLPTSINNSLNNQELVQTEYIHSPTSLENEPKGVNTSTERSSKLNTTLSDTQTKYLPTSAQNSEKTQQLIVPSKGEIQTQNINIQSPFIHQPTGVDVVLTQGPTQQNTTDNETQDHEIAISIQNALDNQQSRQQYKAQAKHIRQPTGNSEELPDVPNITGNETRTKEFLDNDQNSLNKTANSQQVPQPEDIPGKIPFIDKPIGINQNVTDNKTRISNLATDNQQSLNSQSSLYSYKQEEHQPYQQISTLAPFTQESENESETKGLISNVQNPPLDQTGNVTNETTISETKLSHDSEAETDKLIINVTHTNDVTNIKQSFIYLQKSNTTDEINDNKTNTPGVKNASNTLKPTPNKPSNQNPERQKSVPRRPITRKIFIRLPVIPKRAVSESGALDLSTPPTTSTPSHTFDGKRSNLSSPDNISAS